MADRVLLTGISGFVGGHVALQLLNAGYAVRGSLRDLARAGKVRDTLARAGADTARLDFVALELTRDDGWAEALNGCRYLQHIASPFAMTMPRDRQELIGPALDGTTRAIEVALAAQVERIVLTSSMAAIAYGHASPRSAPFTAADWTVLEGKPVNAYIESKTRAERRAWALMDAAGRHDDLAVINPGAILGPLLDDDAGTSATIVQRLLNGTVPAAPRIPLTLVDVRDVAAAHRTAMTSPAAGGRRFPMGNPPMLLIDVATILRARLPQASRKVPRLPMPDWVLRLYGLFDRDIRDNIGELGVTKHLDCAAVEALLGRPLLAADPAIIATATALIAHGLV